MPQEKRPTKKQSKRVERESNVVAIVAIVVLGALSYFDLQNVAADLPVYVYYGLIGAALGAKWEALADRLGGKK